MIQISCQTQPILRNGTRPVTRRSKGQHLNQVANLVVNVPRVPDRLGYHGPQQLAKPLAQPIDRDFDGPRAQPQFLADLEVTGPTGIALKIAAQRDEQLGLALFDPRWGLDRNLTINPTG